MIHSGSFKKGHGRLRNGESYRIGGLKLRDRPLSKEHRQKISSANLGKKLSKEHRRKLSLAHKGKPSHRKGKKNSPEHIEKIRVALTGRIRPKAENSSYWVGDDGKYSTFHVWILKVNGKASMCENRENKILKFQCKGVCKVFDHALKKGHEYTRNIEDYLQLCRSCHIFYDKKRIVS